MSRNASKERNITPPPPPQPQRMSRTTSKEPSPHPRTPTPAYVTYRFQRMLTSPHLPTQTTHKKYERSKKNVKNVKKTRVSTGGVSINKHKGWPWFGLPQHATASMTCKEISTGESECHAAKAGPISWLPRHQKIRSLRSLLRSIHSPNTPREREREIGFKCHCSKGKQTREVSKNQHKKCKINA